MAGAKKKKSNRGRIVAAIVSAVILFAIIGRFLASYPIPVLQPAGPIAAGEKQLLIIAFLLMLLVVIPVLVMTFAIAWRYRESNKKATFSPNWDRSRAAETTWWLIPSVLIAILAVMTWHSSYKYDPYRPIASTHKALNVQVVALNWHWLFIYPEQKMASIDKMYLPVNTPVKFDITADAPMNSFWIPQLGGQIYAMPGMSTQLNLMADRMGVFNGSSANLSGRGFSDMRFKAIATNEAQFNNWTKVASVGLPLSYKQYTAVAALGRRDVEIKTYGKPDADLYDRIINKYMNTHQNNSTLEGM